MRRGPFPRGYAVTQSLSRRLALGLAATSLAGPAFAQPAAMPAGPIRIIVPFAAGGSTDAVARLVTPGLTQRFGQPVVVENRSGAAGSIGTDAVAKATPDGLTWLLTFDSHAVLPAASIILASIGTWAIAMRGMVISVRGEDYIMLAEAKGLRPRRVFYAYGLRNAMLPQLTHLALTLSHIVSGAILVEVIFAYPGIGYRLYQAIHAKDYFVIQGIVLLLSVSIAIAMFILDLIYPLIDPRITAKGR